MEIRKKFRIRRVLHLHLSHNKVDRFRFRLLNFRYYSFKQIAIGYLGSDRGGYANRGSSYENTGTWHDSTTPSPERGINPGLRIAPRRDGRARRVASRRAVHVSRHVHTQRITHDVRHTSWIVKDVTGFNSAVCRCSSDRNRACAPRMTETRAAGGLAVESRRGRGG